MPTIYDLKKSVSELSEEELMDLILQTRMSRHTSKAPERAARVEVKKIDANKKISQSTADKILNGLTPEMAAKLAEALLARRGKQ